MSAATLDLGTYAGNPGLDAVCAIRGVVAGCFAVTCEGNAATLPVTEIS